MASKVKVTRWRSGLGGPELILLGTPEETSAEAEQYFNPGDELAGIPEEMEEEAFHSLPEFESE